MQQENTSDALQHPPSFDQMVGLIKKLFTDYLEDVMKTPPSEISKAWERYKTLNHLYQDEALPPAGCEWVKCSDWLPGYKNSVKWRVSGSDVVRNATLEALLRDRNFYFKSWEWYDESPAPAAGREEEAVGLIKYIRENYKPSKEVWKDKFGIALLSDEGIFSMFIQQKEGKV
jgi:hypothetical protein